MDSLGKVSQKNTIDWLNTYFGRLCHHQGIQLTGQSIVLFSDIQPSESSIFVIITYHLEHTSKSYKLVVKYEKEQVRTYSVHAGINW
jgi:hypothetical protein